MNPIVKKSVVSLVIAVIAFLILRAIESSSLQIPSTGQDFAALGVIFLAILSGSLVNGTPRSGTSPGRSASASTSGAASSDDVESGTVKWFNVKKGYGFITRDQGDDVFVHYRNILGDGRRAVSEGQRVQFIVIDGDKGLQADEVETI